MIAMQNNPLLSVSLGEEVSMHVWTAYCFNLSATTDHLTEEPLISIQGSPQLPGKWLENHRIFQYFLVPLNLVIMYLNTFTLSKHIYCHIFVNSLSQKYCEGLFKKGYRILDEPKCKTVELQCQIWGAWAFSNNIYERELEKGRGLFKSLSALTQADDIIRVCDGRILS